MTTSIDTMIEERFHTIKKNHIGNIFVDVDNLVSTTLEGDERETALAYLNSLKERLLIVQYTAGIADHKRKVVERMTDRVGYGFGQ